MSKTESKKRSKKFFNIKPQWLCLYIHTGFKNSTDVQCCQIRFSLGGARFMKDQILSQRKNENGKISLCLQLYILLPSHSITNTGRFSCSFRKSCCRLLCLVVQVGLCFGALLSSALEPWPEKGPVLKHVFQTTSLKITQ